MSVIRMNHFSQALNMCATVNVILPMPRRVGLAFSPLPVLYLLHGMGDDFSCWLRKTGVERYALEAGLAVVMPDGGLSCYENMVHGPRYRDYIARELPEFMLRTFPLSRNRAETYIAGCSMGGFGALKIGLDQPERFSVIGCLSAAHAEYQMPTPRNREILHRVYGQDGIVACNRRTEEAAKRVNGGKIPVKLWHACGDADILKPSALDSRAFFEALPSGALAYQFEMLEGSHDWNLWDRMIQRFIAQLELKKPEVQLL